ncbi:hypothetical protein L596_015637 [Steinernema carpocapsae]|uniref:PDZ domain-containing protein n=1 Tax=Steinernema carpocapsae TaxID=34508 RepID=A0A4U5NG75_STECR|nr:hypothetical protein L596_015637 [Steinernema carpocapsae]
MAAVLKVQLAHGSSVRYVADFKNVAELYRKTAEIFELELEDILFCTVGTHKPDVNALLFGTITENDLIFAHLAGEKLEVELEKTGEYLGVTITDNGAGNVIVRQIHVNTVAAKIGLKPGDVIKAVNGCSIQGLRHCEASAKLRATPIGAKVKLTFVRPFMEGFSFISARTHKRCGKTLFSDDPPLLPPPKPSGTTIRFSLNDGTVIRCLSSENRFCLPSTVIKLNAVLDSYFGFHDDDLAVLLWRFSSRSSQALEFVEIVNSDPETKAFKLPEEILVEMWTVIKRSPASQ